jgi:hypothetical protein
MALLLTVPAGQLRGAGSKLTSTESVSASRQVIHGPAGGGNSGHADSSAAISARGSTGHEPAGGRHDGDASGGTATSPSTTV